ncbi:MAG: rhamnogalacturonan acetylesterase [Clostridia bacterium]|nr:rhamnogalacturonan acetylesterase [Clostridia bacterium]
MRKTLKGLVTVGMVLLLMTGFDTALAQQTTVTEDFNGWTGSFGNEESTTDGLNTIDFAYTPKQFSNEYVYGKSVKEKDGDNALFLGAKFPVRGEEDSIPAQVKPYVVMNTVKKQDIGEKGTAILEFDFKIDNFFEHSGKVGNVNYKSQPFSISGEFYTTEFDFDTVKDSIDGFASVLTADSGKWLGYTDSNNKMQNYNSYLEIQSANKVSVFGTVHTLKKALTEGEWHHLTMAVNSDNTYTLSIDRETVIYNQPIGEDKFRIRYTYTDTSGAQKNYDAATSGVTSFRGFKSLWVQYYEDPYYTDGEQGYYIDNVSITGSDSKLGMTNYVYYEPFDGWNGHAGNKSWTSNADSNVSVYLDGANNYPELSVQGVDGKTADYLSIIYTEDKPRAYMNMTRKDKTGWSNSATGATKLSVDFALSDLDSSAFIGGYILYYDEDGEAQELKYRDNTQATGAFIKITGTTASAWGNTTNLETPLETNKWYTATLYMNGDYTYSLYIDDTAIFQNKKIVFDNFGDFYHKTTDETIMPDNFLGFTQIWLQRGAKNDSANATVYYDNVQLVTTNQYYSADTSSQDSLWAQEAANSLKIYTTHVENGLALDSIVAINGAENVATVTWESSNPDVISNYGEVYPVVGQEKKVTMTATVTYQMASVTKTFEITVPAVNAYTITGVKITGEDGIVDNALVGGKTVSEVSVKRYTDSNEKIYVMTALYKNEILQDMTVNEITPEIAQYSNGDIALEKAITLPENIDGCRLMVMIWEDMTELKPLAKALTVEKQKSQITIYTAGDSTVQTYGATAKPQEGWGQNIAAFLTEEAAVDNSQSMGGRTTKSFIAEKRLETILNRIQPGDYLLVQFGHNDAKKDVQKSSLDGTYISRGTSLDEYQSYARYLEIYVDAARDKGANVILISSVNRVKDRTGENLEGYPEAMRAFAAEKNVPILDLTAKSIELQKKLDAAEIAPENLYLYWRAGDTRFDFEGSTLYKNTANYADGTHFNSYGAKCIAQLIAKELTAMGSPLSRFVDESTYFNVLEEMPTPVYTK